jgi:hypothetical protein
MPARAPHLWLTKVYRRSDMSIDDIRFKLLERDRLAALDDRSEAAKWLGDPPPWRSALGTTKSPRGHSAEQNKCPLIGHQVLNQMQHRHCHAYGKQDDGNSQSN